MPKLSSLVFLAPLSLALWLGGCGLGKVAECNKLIQAANAQSQAIHDSSGKIASGAGAAGEIDALAATFDSAASGVGAVALKDAKLVGFQKDYKDMMTRAAKSCRDMSAAMRAKSMAQVSKAKAELDSVTGNESKVTNEINTYCTS